MGCGEFNVFFCFFLIPIRITYAYNYDLEYCSSSFRGKGNRGGGGEIIKPVILTAAISIKSDLVRDA